jgi:hypothetical protein
LPELQLCPEEQLPQLPPHPLSPQVFPVQLGVQATQEVPFVLQTVLLLQVPHVPPQPSDPQTLPVQLGVQVIQAPLESQIFPEGQLPQLLPQPLDPQTLLVQEGVQLQFPTQKKIRVALSPLQAANKV